MQSSAGLHKDFERGALNPGRTCTEPELWTAPVLFQNLVGGAKHNCALSLHAMIAMQNRIVFFAPAMHSMQSMSCAQCGGEVKRCHGNATNICVKQFSPWHGVANILQHNQVFTVLVSIGCTSQADKLLCFFLLKTICIPVLNTQQHKEYFCHCRPGIFSGQQHTYVANPWQLTFICSDIWPHQPCISTCTKICLLDFKFPRGKYSEKQQREGEIRRWVRLLIVPTLRA